MSCERRESSLMLSMATTPATNCTNMNSIGTVETRVESNTVTIWAKNAVRESRNTTSTIGMRVNGATYRPEVKACDTPNENSVNTPITTMIISITRRSV